jgi:riboflavin kinase/FMN adenylyltransferase
MGCFDGVHLGHQQVIATAVEQAAASGGEAWVFTFNPHPAKVLSPATAPQLISAESCRLRQFAALGVHGVISVPFDTTFAHMEPAEFFAALRQNLPTLSGIVCGTDWSFGHRARGKFSTLQTLCAEYGITATAVPPVLYNGEKISSTQIRQALRDGNIPLAEQLLGRPFCIFGTVVRGRGIGRGLGFPTANIAPENELIPAPGVYAAYAKVQRPTSNVESQASNTRPSPVDLDPLTITVPAAVFIGERKTFGDPSKTIEAHLFDYAGDLYEQPIETCLVRKIRDVEAFPSKDALIAQIAKDIAQIRRVLAGGF